MLGPSVARQFIGREHRRGSSPGPGDAATAPAAAAANRRAAMHMAVGVDVFRCRRIRPTHQGRRTNHPSGTPPAPHNSRFPLSPHASASSPGHRRLRCGIHRTRAPSRVKPDKVTRPQRRTGGGQSPCRDAHGRCGPCLPMLAPRHGSPPTHRLPLAHHVHAGRSAVHASRCRPRLARERVAARRGTPRAGEDYTDQFSARNGGTAVAKQRSDRAGMPNHADQRCSPRGSRRDVDRAPRPPTSAWSPLRTHREPRTSSPPGALQGFAREGWR